jgi:glycosyltransferase involved in cell wall biosynthesis
MTSAKLPQIGVIVAAHNCAGYIAQAILSVSGQTVGNLEVVIVDDASNDGTADVIRDVLANIADSRFCFICHDTNRGQAGAVRSGLAKIKSPFVSILDGDDVWHESFIERHLAAHLNTIFPVGFSYCNSHFINGSGEVLAGTAWWFNRSGHEAPHRLIDRGALPTIDPAMGLAHFPANSEVTLHENWSPTWSCNSMASMMFRRELVELVFPSVDEQVRLYLDFYLATFCMLIAGGVAIHDALYSYRMHGNNSHSNGKVVGGTFATSSHDWKSISQRILALVLHEMEARRSVLSLAIGEGHFNRSLMQLKTGIPEADRWLAHDVSQRRRLPGLSALCKASRHLNMKP